MRDQRLRRGPQFYELPDTEARIDQRSDIRHQGAVIFDDIRSQPLGVPWSFLLVVVYRPMQSLPSAPLAPLLRCNRREDRMLDGNHQRAAVNEAVMHPVTDKIEARDIVQGERTDHDVEGICSKVNVLDGGPAIFNPWIVGSLPGAREHIFG